MQLNLEVEIVSLPSNNGPVRIFNAQTFAESPEEGHQAVRGLKSDEDETPFGTRSAATVTLDDDSERR